MQSLMFRQAMQAANGDKGGGGGASNFKPSQEMSQPVDDRVGCKWCGRKFNEEAGKRHFPHCEQKYKQNLIKNGGKQTKRGTQVGFKK